MAGEENYVVDVKIDRIIDLVLSAQKSLALKEIRAEFGEQVVTVPLPLALAIKEMSQRSNLFTGILPLDYDHCTRRAIR
ncbi:hypothetical protein B5U98_21010 [Bosea sp. Tri-39]|nr:hypothetical protein B5U98_21010 [Bosea sp. Tri-39]RXT37317.1 hypothetical protein B5U99_15325 [Bosea sp. Tri-54]